MYEVMEVMRDREFKKKILMIVLKDEDKRFYKNYEKLMVESEEFRTLKVGAVIQKENGKFVVDKATMSRSARIIMEGFVHDPARTME